MGVISALQQEVHSLQAEVDLVRAEIIKYSKYRENDHHHNPVLVPSHSYLANLLASTSGVVSVGAPPTVQPSSQPLPPPPLPLASSSSCFYTPIISTASDYTTISNENIPYFG